MSTPTDRGGHSTQAEAGHYAAFGLSLEIDPRIDAGALGMRVASGDAVPTTRVRLDPRELARRWRGASEDASRMRELCAGGSPVLTVDLAEPAGYLVWIENVGRMLVAGDGSEVVCDPLVEAEGWEFILPAQILPLAATLSGHEVLHAAGLVLDGGATLLSGPPGAGKSSLAAAMLRRGAELLSDDCVALERREGSLLAHPGAGVLYLRGSEHERLSPKERAALGTSRDFAGKQRYGSVPASVAAPFAALFLLERAAQGALVEPIEDADPFELLAATFNLSVRTPERLTRQLDVVGELVDSGRVHRLRVLPGTNATQLARVVEGYLETVAG